MNWLDRRRDYLANESEPRSEMKLSKTPIVTISGEPWTGKTEMIINQMIISASEGLQVGYVGYTMQCSSGVQRRILERDDPAVVGARHSGDHQIRYASGGRITFISSDRDALRGRDLDVLVWDSPRPVPDGAVYAAKLIYHLNDNPRRKLLRTLRKCVDMRSYENAHVDADDGLIEYINDPEVTRLYYSIHRIYR